ncbi:MAG: ribosome maturation factor RimM [Christensenellaceae bacterium]|jgi:16S rRNA processing protein RimM|nr:ribosome maturation factor RimM [Christensenellaceae bacterium]
MVALGKVLKPQGIKGELKIRCYLDDPQTVREMKSVVVGKTKHSIEKFRADGEFIYAVISGIYSREAAEALRNLDVEIDESELPALPDDAFYVRDVLGAKIYLQNASALFCANNPSNPTDNLQKSTDSTDAVVVPDSVPTAKAAELLGTLLYIDNYGRNDIYTIKTVNKGECSVPVTPNLIISIDIATKTIIFDSKTFNETAVFND